MLINPARCHPSFASIHHCLLSTVDRPPPTAKRPATRPSDFDTVASSALLVIPVCPRPPIAVALQTCNVAVTRYFNQFAAVTSFSMRQADDATTRQRRVRDGMATRRLLAAYLYQYCVASIASRLSLPGRFPSRRCSWDIKLYSWSVPSLVAVRSVLSLPE